MNPPKTKSKGRKRIHDILEPSKVRVKKLGINNDSLFQFFKSYNQGILLRVIDTKIGNWEKKVTHLFILIRKGNDLKLQFFKFLCPKKYDLKESVSLNMTLCIGLLSLYPVFKLCPCSSVWFECKQCFSLLVQCTVFCKRNTYIKYQFAQFAQKKTFPWQKGHRLLAQLGQNKFHNIKWR